MKSLTQYANNTVLIIDDSSKFVKTAVKYLKSCGLIKIHSASNGIEGINFAKKIKPDIVLLDIEMDPGMSGFEVLEQFHKNNLDLKVLLITGHDTGLIGMRGARLGITDFVSKAVFLENIEVKIMEALDFGHTISEKNNTPKNIINTNFDILERTLKDYNIVNQDELIIKLNQLRDEIKNNSPDKNKISRIMDFIKNGVAGNLAASGIIEVAKGLLSLI
jgi:DNA-binding NtrC family response regulator